MKNLTRFFYIVMLFAAHQALAQILLPAPTAGEYEIRGEFSYFNSSSNYINDGTTTSLPYGKFNTMMGTGEFILDMTREIRLNAGFIGGQTAVDRANLSSGKSETHTNMGVSEAWVGAQYWMRMSGFSLVPEARFTYPFFRVDTNSADPLLGEGAMRMQVGAGVVTHFSSFRPFGFLDYQYSDEGRAGTLPYRVGAQWLPMRSPWWAQVDLHGQFVMQNDSITGDHLARDSYLRTYEGGSDRFYAVNPSSHEIGLSAGTHFGQMGLYAGYDMTYMGKNSAAGWTAYAGVTFDGTLFAATPQVRRQEKYQDSNYSDGFEAPAEKYDDRLFNDKAEAQPPAANPEPVVTPVTRPRATAPAKKRPVKTGPSVDSLLQDATKDLEKREPKSINKPLPVAPGVAPVGN